MFGVGWQEILLIVLIVLLLFGAKRIPEVMRSLGKGVAELKKGMKEGEAGSDTKKKDDEGPKAD
jgi:sec-independent protein translocase protein TatA